MHKNMRLADFIGAEMESILQEWEDFAKTIFSARRMSKVGLRDHARQVLLEIVNDLDSPQSDSEQDAKSKGDGPEDGVASWATVHGDDRQRSGFSVMEAISEFRALRASVVSQWTKAHPTITGDQLEDLTRFHEAIDQALDESLEQYTVQKEMETRLFSTILRASPDPIYVLDLKGRFVFANKATAELFALEPEAIVGKSTFELGFPFASDFQHNLEKVVADQSTYRGEFVHTFASGRGESFEYQLAPVLDEQRRTEVVVCIARDVTEQTLAEKKVWHAAHHDQLTGLPNRRLFLDRLEQAIKGAKRSNRSLSVLFMDLNGFKAVNDSFGHEAGDAVLADAANRLIYCVRDEDTVARLGGDEFSVVVTGANKREDVELVAKKIKDALSMPFRVEQQPVQISASIGISFYPQDASSPSALLAAADRAMYEAKNSSSDQT